MGSQECLLQLQLSTELSKQQLSNQNALLCMVEWPARGLCVLFLKSPKVLLGSPVRVLTEGGPDRWLGV